jgi:hypothetical protein
VEIRESRWLDCALTFHQAVCEYGEWSYPLPATDSPSQPHRLVSKGKRENQNLPEGTHHGQESAPHNEI